MREDKRFSSDGFKNRPYPQKRKPVKRVTFSWAADKHPERKCVLIGIQLIAESLAGNGDQNAGRQRMHQLREFPNKHELFNDVIDAFEPFIREDYYKVTGKELTADIVYERNYHAFHEHKGKKGSGSPGMKEHYMTSKRLRPYWKAVAEALNSRKKISRPHAIRLCTPTD